jgi:hypothetical protein
MKVLEIEVKITTQPVRLSGPCMMEVRIINKSQQSVVLNRRLAVGYRNSDARELFVEVFERASNQLVSQEALLYQRDFAAPEDYLRIAPGESIAGSLDLFEWYKLRLPGDYEVVVYYQADETLAPKPADLLTGTHASERIPFTVIP